jgi:hypothetical protein
MASKPKRHPPPVPAPEPGGSPILEDLRRQAAAGDGMAVWLLKLLERGEKASSVK